MFALENFNHSVGKLCSEFRLLIRAFQFYSHVDGSVFFSFLIHYTFELINNATNINLIEYGYFIDIIDSALSSITMKTQHYKCEVSNINRIQKKKRLCVVQVPKALFQ